MANPLRTSDFVAGGAWLRYLMQTRPPRQARGLRTVTPGWHEGLTERVKHAVIASAHAGLRPPEALGPFVVRRVEGAVRADPLVVVDLELARGPNSRDVTLHHAVRAASMGDPFDRIMQDAVDEVILHGIARSRHIPILHEWLAQDLGY